jgi:queuine tRNA-ribosyltransferase
MFELEAIDCKARAGVLKTHHGNVETPSFMPVATKAVVKTLTPEDVWETGARMLICNSLHLHLRPGTDLIKRMGGIHQYMGWGGAVFTDSGGFQLIRSGFDLKIRDIGIKYRNSLTGSVEELTPEKSVELQRDLGSDVAMALDDCPKYGTGKAGVSESCARTIDWARRAADAEPAEGQMFFGIIQGGLDEGLRKGCADALVSLGLAGFGIGGLSIGEPKDDMMRAVRWSLEAIPVSKPRYLMGVGSAAELLDSIGEGIDLFDSAFPTRNARHWTIMTSEGSYSLTRAEHSDVTGPLEEGCGCPVCHRFSRAYLHHLCKENEMLAMRLASIHNLFFVGQLMQQARDAIRHKRFAQYREEFLEGFRKPTDGSEEE